MAAGSVTISASGGETLTGAAGRLYTIRKARAVLKLAAFGQTIPAGAEGVEMKQAIADEANDLATWLITELTAQTVATVGTGLAGLQRMPAVTTEDTDTKAPSPAKTIPLTHTT